jgi:glycosyltransferase 2 family protein
LNPSLTKILKTLLKLIVSGLALVFVFNKIDLNSLWDLLKHCRVMLLILAAIFFILSKILSAYRLNFFFRSVDIALPDLVNLKLYWLGMFYNLFLPGGIGGDGYKVYLLHRKLNSPVKKSILAAIFDRLSGMLALLLLCLCFALFIDSKFIPDVYLILISGLGIVVFYFSVYKWFNVFYHSLHSTNLLALGTQLSQVISAFLILWALGNESQTVEYLFVFLISSIVAVIPFTIGGVGAREVAFLYASKFLHLDISLSIALSLLFFFITAVVSLSGIIYVFRPESMNLENDRVTE